MRRIARLFALTLLLATPARADELVVFAAASLKTALDAVTTAFAEATGTEVAVSYAGSSQLARQILLGAPADVVLSANTDWMDELDTAGRLEPGSRRALLGNRLVLVAHGAGAAPVELTDPAALDTRLGAGRLAMALVEAVPAGIYGRAALVELGLWERVAERVAQSDNVRAALALVATGAAPLGLVYASDARAEPRRFAAGLARYGSDFLVHLHSPSARAAFEAQGFSWLGE